jgi:transposase
MAAHQKKARRQHAHLVLIDESGLLMAPLVRRTWAPRGQRPMLTQKTRHREKVSVAAALWLSPRRDRLGLCFQTLVNAYFNNTQVALFLEALLETLPGRLVVVWDGGGMHKGNPIDRLLEQAHHRLSLELLPPYAPMLMPVEQVWTWLKYGRLCNFAPHDAHHLNECVLAELTAIQDHQEQLRNFFHASQLPLPRTLLS